MKGTIGEFSLTDQNGRSVGRDDLRGEIWVADFIFTRCVGPCPLMTRTLQRLQDEIPSEVQFVSFTVDPDHDTPDCLLEYADRFDADLSRWSFLTGEKKRIYELARSMNLTASENEDQFIHSSRYVLIDPAGAIRGTMLIVNNDLSVDGEQPARFKAEVQSLLSEMHR